MGNEVRRRNGIGLAGFILSLVSIVFSLVWYVGIVVWFLGLVFSFIGVFKKPRAFAVAGLIISLIDVFIFIFVVGLFAALVSALM